MSLSTITLGTRGSKLALIQSQWVADQLIRLNPGLEVRTQIIKTSGDKDTNRPLYRIGGTGLFVKEIEQALLDERIDFAVHSAKDVPSDMDSKFTIAAYPARESPFDALVSNGLTLAGLPSGARVGTSSSRRRAQIAAARPDLELVDLRGNLDTRLAKVDRGDCDAAVLACAGLQRMGLADRVTEVLPPEICLPAVGQGALAVQCRAGDQVADALCKLDDSSTRRCVTAERALMRALQAGCQTPVAALAIEADGMLRLDALVASPDGSAAIRRAGELELHKPEELGRLLAEEILAAGGKQLLEQVRQSGVPRPQAP